MTISLSILGDFGSSSLADGAEAARYRIHRIEPYIALCESIELDFSGIRSSNSSFMNALISGLIEQHGPSALDRVVFKGCNPVVRVLIESAEELGIQKFSERASA